MNGEPRSNNFFFLTQRAFCIDFSFSISGDVNFENSSKLKLHPNEALYYMVQMGKFTEATRVVLADRDRKWNVSVTKMKKNQIDTKVERVERVEGVVEVEGDEQQKEEEEEETMTVKTPLLQLACKTSVGTLHEMTYNRLFLHPVPSDKKEEWLITVRFYFFLLVFVLSLFLVVVF